MVTYICGMVSINTSTQQINPELRCDGHISPRRHIPGGASAAPVWARGAAPSRRSRAPASTPSGGGGPGSGPSLEGNKEFTEGFLRYRVH